MKKLELVQAGKMVEVGGSQNMDILYMSES